MNDTLSNRTIFLSLLSRSYQSLSFNFVFSGKPLNVFAIPVNNQPSKFNIFVNEASLGTIQQTELSWQFTRNSLSPKLADAIGKYLPDSYCSIRL